MSLDQEQAIKDRVHYLQAELSRARRKAQEHRMELRDLDTRISLLEKWEAELKPVLCRSCNGLGKLREWFAQDESRLVVCDVCNGTGLPAKGEK